MGRPYETWFVPWHKLLERARRRLPIKQILIAFVASTVLLALEDALARQCRNLLWSGILPLAALLSSVGLLAAGALPLQAPYVLLCAVLNGALWSLWIAGRRKHSRAVAAEKRAESEK